MIKYYFDTGIWIDLFEDRNEPNFPKGTLVKQLINKIARDECKIVFSNSVTKELTDLNYFAYEVYELLESLKPILIFARTTSEQVRKSKDLSLKRDIPKMDAIHALIARDNRAILVTLDKHFEKLKDIVVSKKPRDLLD